MGLRRTVFFVSLVTIASVLRAVPAQAATVASACSGNTAGDFNQDGYKDLAIGAPFEDVDGVANAGAVNVLYGSATGLDTVGNQTLTQNSPGVNDLAEAGDQFGSCLAAGDYNGDGQSDLAIGIPGEDIGTISDAGAIAIIYGGDSLDALGPPTDDFIHQGSTGVPGDPEEGDQYGSSLAAGYFNSDAFQDLAVGAPFEDIFDLVDAGAIWVFDGGNGGVLSTGIDLFYQGAGGVNDTAERFDQFGASLTAGDFDGDTLYDLAVGVPQEGVGAVSKAGAVQIFMAKASGTGIDASRDKLISQNTGTIADASEANDAFGKAVSAGNFNGDQYDDLAIGVPLEDLVGGGDAGLVNVVYGSATGIGTSGNQALTQTIMSVTGGDEVGDQFGAALSSGDYDGDGNFDLAIGIPFEDGAATNDGAIVSLYGSGAGLNVGSSGPFDQSFYPSDPDGQETNDRFGSALVSGDYDGDAQYDIVASAPNENVNGDNAAGAIDVAYDGSPGSGDAYFIQDDFTDDLSAAGNKFGSTVG